MQFLREEFIDQLRAEVDETTGNVVIEAASFTPRQILEFNSETFEMSFQEWCADRKTQYIEQAERILSLYDNKDRFDSLLQAYRRGSVIPFVGAGLSIPSGYIGWTDFLRATQRETTVSSDDLEALLSTYQYEEAAELLYNAMPHGRFNEFLANKFDNERKLSGCVRFLPDCFSTSVVTTNFDNVLRKSYNETDKVFDEELLGADAIELPRLLGQGKNVLVKLHGKASSAQNRILTKSEYDRHYTAETNLPRGTDLIIFHRILS